MYIFVNESCQNILPINAYNYFRYTLICQIVIEASETASIEVKSVAAVVYFDETEGLVPTF